MGILALIVIVFSAATLFFVESPDEGNASLAEDSLQDLVTTQEMDDTQRARDSALEYVYHLYCYTTFNGHNLEEINFEELGENMYLFGYRFEVTSANLSAEFYAVEANLTVQNGVVIDAEVNYLKFSE